ncbi:MAG TPA: hypothetical protein VMT96_01055 [Candidatus Bathyarchaeia archaeon]|nr:hypothetical protein [Candidatus Bathyarchaeia archaeon]
MAQKQLGASPSNTSDAATKTYVDNVGSTTATASTVARWDANVNLSTNNLFEKYTTIATVAGTTTLTISSTPIQIFTGTTTQTVTLPTTSVPQGAQYLVVNQSTGAVTVQSSGANNILVLAGSTSGVFTANVATPTAAADWASQYGGTSVVSGKQLSINNTMTFSAFDGATFNFAGTPTTITSAVTGIGSATQTVVASYTFPANLLTSGQAFQFQLFGTQSSTSGSMTYYVCVGTAGTSADTVVTSVVAPSAASAGASMSGILTVRTIGSNGTCIASGVAMGSAVSSASVSTTTATTTINTTVQNYLTLQMKISGAGSHTVQQAFISVAQV